VLYIGTSKDLRARVRSYFTASETRSHMGEMVGLAAAVEGVTCATALEAEVRELRLIAQHKPRYNRRSRHPERVVWVKLTVEPWPRLSLVRQVLDDEACYVGPFSARLTAERALAALHDAFLIRQCSGRLPRRPSRHACVLAEMGRCLSPCDGSADGAAYAAEVHRVRRSLLLDPEPVVGRVTARMSSLAAQERYEEAGRHRDRLSAFLRGTARTQRLSSLTQCAQVVAGRRLDGGGWEVHVIRFGRLAAAGVMRPGRDASSSVAELVAAAETVATGPGPAPAASAAETEAVLRWLERDGTRLIEVDGVWSCPVGGAGRHLRSVEQTISLVPFDERRQLATEHQPPR
jgi:DNA polymerase-3 subunit epsilon